MVKIRINSGYKYNDVLKAIENSGIETDDEYDDDEEYIGIMWYGDYYYDELSGEPSVFYEKYQRSLFIYLAAINVADSLKLARSLGINIRSEEKFIASLSEYDDY